MLRLSDDARFNISYRKVKDEDNSWEKIRAATEKSTFLKLSGYHALKGALDTGSAIDWQNWINRDRAKLNDIARILSFHEDESQIRAMLAELGLDEVRTQRLIGITHFSKTIDLSVKAVERILPYLQQGRTYDKACKEAGYHHSRIEPLGAEKVPALADIRNPVVNRAMAQARKVINACIREHGMPDTIVVELARGVGRNFKDRKDIEREQKKNQAYREEARQHLAEEILGMLPENVRGEDILKYRLWKEQNGTCPYSGEYIAPERLRDSAATQIDHIIPYQRSWNDSYMNKVLCVTSENQEKRNDTPVEYFNRTGRNVDALTAFARRLPPRKAENLLIENFDEKAEAWKDRALNDTRYIAKLLKNHLERSLDLKSGVQTRNGALTAHLRSLWGFAEKDRANDRHHALDAIVIACSTRSMVQQVAEWHRYRKTPKKPRVAKPWDSFREDALAAVGGIFVSRMPVRKVTGAAHEETIRSIRETGDGGRQVIQSVKLRSLSPATLENLVDKERNIALYNVLKNRLDAHGGKPDKAFAEPVHMPTRDPLKQGPRINSVRVATNEKSGVHINQGLASNGDMVRVDVFQKHGKYYLVPIYVYHFAARKLPNKAIMQGKLEEEWEEMYDKDFIFSLHKNDFVRIKNKKEEIVGYFAGADRSNASISVRAHDNTPSFGKDGVKSKIGVKTLLAFEKYTVDYFGNILPKQPPGIREKRVGLAYRDDPEPGAAEPFEGAIAAGE